MTCIDGAMSAELGKVLREAREQAKRNQSEVAAVVGVTRQAVGQWESGDNAPALEKLKALTAYLGIDTDSALNGILKYRSDPASAPARRDGHIAEFGVAPNDGGSDRRPVRDVPILGFAVGGKSGEFQMNGETVDRAPRPSALLRTKNAYAVYVFNDSMSPRFDPGDLLYVNPDKPPHIGDDVLIELRPKNDEAFGDAFIKRLVRRSGSTVICEQFNPPKQVTFKAADIKTFHRIVPRNELFGS